MDDPKKSSHNFCDAADLSEFDWPYGGYAPGNYSTICGRCKRQVINVDKRAIRCLPCAMHGMNEAARTSELNIDTKKAMEIDHFQSLVAAWCVDCFGKTTAADVVERNWRFLEEALELVQSLGGNAEDAHKLVDYVFGREKGEPHQEVGGTMITLAALIAANGLSLSLASWDELLRISKPEMIDKIRAKHASKPHRSPLPGDYKHAPGS